MDDAECGWPLDVSGTEGVKSASGAMQVPQISDPCRDMIERMLVSNPEQRISMSEIKRHPFFREGLPDGALGMNDCLLRNRPFHDPQVRPPGRWSRSRVLT